MPFDKGNLACQVQCTGADHFNKLEFYGLNGIVDVFLGRKTGIVLQQVDRYFNSFIGYNGSRKDDLFGASALLFIGQDVGGLQSLPVKLVEHVLSDFCVRALKRIDE